MGHANGKAKKVRARWETYGVTPSDKKAAVKYLRADQPSFKDHRDRMNRLNTNIQDVDDEPIIIQYRKDLADGNFITPFDERE